MSRLNRRYPVSHGHRIYRNTQTGGFLTVFNKIKDGKPQDFFSVLADVGKDIQSVIDFAAPHTKKIVGPIATALTGVNIPNPADVLGGDSNALAMGKASAQEILTKNESKLRSLMDNGIAGIPAATQKSMSGKGKTQKGKGYSKVIPMK